MAEYRLGEVEKEFADIIWNNEPLSSGELAKRCMEVLGWKKSTTYTVLKRVCERGLFCNEEGVVRSLVSRDEFLAGRCDQFVQETFDGSLPGFIAAFTRQRKLSEEEIGELLDIIEQSRR